MSELRKALESGNYLQVYDHRQNRWLSPDEAVAALSSKDEPLDVRPELLAWFHESEEICEHDARTDGRDWPCGIMADHFLRAFTAEPRLREIAPGHWGYEERHFRRLDLAAALSKETPA